MTNKGTLFMIMMLLCGALTLWGCPKKTEVTSAPAAQDTAAPSAAAAQAPASAPETARAAEESKEAQERAALAAAGLKPVYFDYDRSGIRDDARDVMKANADWIKAHPNAKVKIEGNCDERGTIEYNQALGQRRAASARQYLAGLGATGSRITLISYGKEKPACTEGTEACWQKNRRCDFVVLSN